MLEYFGLLLDDFDLSPEKDMQDNINILHKQKFLGESTKNMDEKAMACQVYVLINLQKLLKVNSRHIGVNFYTLDFKSFCYPNLRFSGQFSE